MSQYVTFLLVGLAAGAAFSAVALSLVVTFKGTGVINFAAGAMAAWGCYVFDELRRDGNLFFPLPFNHDSTLGDDGSYGGFPLLFFAVVSGALLYGLIHVLVRRPVRKRRPALDRPVALAAGIASLVWAVIVLVRLRTTGEYMLPLIPYRVNVGIVGFFPALVIAAASAALVGLAAHFLVFAPLRTAPPLAKVVASIGLMTTLQALIVFRFGSVPRSVDAIFPPQKVKFAGVEVPRDRLFLAGAAIVLALLLWAFFRYTRTGLATRAAAENERAASLARYSPPFLAATTWVLSSVGATVLLILTLPVIPLSPTVHTLMIVPALACALVGRLKYIGQTVAAALTLGAVQSIFTFLSSKDWWPESMRVGLSDAVPFIVLIVVLFVMGRSLPTRGAIRVDRLPDVIIPRNRPPIVAGMAVVGLLAILLTHGGYRFGVISSMMFTLVTLSVVLLTGLIGQISLAQAALAGTSGFALSKLADGAGIGFPWSMILAALVATAFGVVVGIPALRIRGAQLAVVTLAAAVALEKFVLRNPSLTSAAGNPIPPAKFLGADLRVREGSTVARWQFGVMVLIVVFVVGLAVANLMRSGLGRRFLAVRSNERAAAAVGINVAASKLLGFAIASFIAGVAGSLIGYSRGQLSADSFSTFVNVSFLAFAYLGGITSVSGAIVGGAFAPLGIGFVLSDRLLNVGSVYGLAAGIGVILTAIFNPVGIAGANRAMFDQLVARYRRWRPRATAGAAADAAGAVAATATATATATAVAVAPTGPASAARPPRLERMDAPVILALDDVSVSYGGVRAVNGVTMEVRKGEIVGLIGPNGAGKTSLVDAITGFTSASGSIVFRGEAIDHLAPHRRARQGLSRTWQAGELFDDLTLRQNLRVAADRADARSVVLDVVHPERRVDQPDVAWSLDLLGLTADADERPQHLSLGRQKLAGVARALANRPGIVLLDEPAAGLDSTESAVLGERLHDITEHGISVFLIDHDMGLVLRVCDYLYVLEFGVLIAKGTPAEIRNDDAVIEAYLGEAGRKARDAEHAGAGAAAGAARVAADTAEVVP